MSRLLGAFFMLCAAAPVAALPADGPWFDRSRDGHGIDVQRSDNTVLLGLYSFAEDGEPEWYTAGADELIADFDAELLRFKNVGSSSQPSVQSQVVGRLRWSVDADQLATACNDGVNRDNAAELAAMIFSIDGVEHRWCMETALPESDLPDSSLNGTWWGGATDAGWGLTTYFFSSAATRSTVQVLYYYDAAGKPRWSIAKGDYDDFRVSLSLRSPSGYCRDCAAQPLQFRAGGEMDLRLSTPLRSTGLANSLDLRASYPGMAGGDWRRDIELLRISDVQLAPDTLATRDGLIVGREDLAGTWAWQGLPFAQPPLGELRWRAPQPVAGRAAILQATAFSFACPQPPSQGSIPNDSLQQDEDCLTLNVWTPGEPAETPASLPVMVWIHGGGHVQGGAAQRIGDRLVYDGSQFARRGVVLVSINYRLGALGYAVFPEMIDEFAEQPGAGNYGLLDQIAALKWVSENIEQFGGDPSNVTIFGESGGGVSVCALLASPLAEPYFQRAITQSGPCTANMSKLLLQNGNQEAAVEQGERIKQRLNCIGADRRECLRAASAETVVQASNAGAGIGTVGEPYGEVIDGFALPQSLRDAVRSGSASRKDLMVGVNEDETNSQIPASQRPTSVAAYEALVRQQVGAIAPLVLALYPASAYSPVWQAWTAINTDIIFICPSARASRDHSANGNRTFAYYLTQSLPGEEELGAFHGLDVAFLFSDMRQYGASIESLADTMKTLWIGFAVDGRPAAPGVVEWPLHPAASQAGMELRAGAVAPRLAYRDEFCAFWARFVDL